MGSVNQTGDGTLATVIKLPLRLPVARVRSCRALGQHACLQHSWRELLAASAAGACCLDMDFTPDNERGGAA